MVEFRVVDSIVSKNVIFYSRNYVHEREIEKTA